MVYQKVYIFKCHCWYILPVFTILSKTKNKIGKICNMEIIKKNCFTEREKKEDLVFKKPFLVSRNVFVHIRLV